MRRRKKELQDAACEKISVWSRHERRWNFERLGKIRFESPVGPCAGSGNMAHGSMGSPVQLVNCTDAVEEVAAAKSPDAPGE
jgi:hypothetical protein